MTTIARALLTKFEAVSLSKRTPKRVTKTLLSLAAKANWGKRLGLVWIDDLYEVTCFEKMLLLISWDGNSGLIEGALPVDIKKLPSASDFDGSKEVIFFKQKQFKDVEIRKLSDLANEFELPVISKVVRKRKKSVSKVDPKVKEELSKINKQIIDTTPKKSSGPTAFVDDYTNDGQRQVGINDYVRFKSDVEQTGKIIKIGSGSGFRNKVVLTLEALDDEGFEGDYIGGSMTTEELAEDCWVER